MKNRLQITPCGKIWLSGVTATGVLTRIIPHLPGTLGTTVHRFHAYLRLDSDAAGEWTFKRIETVLALSTGKGMICPERPRTSAFETSLNRLYGPPGCLHQIALTKGVLVSYLDLNTLCQAFADLRFDSSRYPGPHCPTRRVAFCTPVQAHRSYGFDIPDRWFKDYRSCSPCTLDHRSSDTPIPFRKPRQSLRSLFGSALEG